VWHDYGKTGAGPAGSTLSVLLPEKGRHVVVLEKDILELTKRVSIKGGIT